MNSIQPSLHFKKRHSYHQLNPWVCAYLPSLVTPLRLLAPWYNPKTGNIRQTFGIWTAFWLVKIDAGVQYMCSYSAACSTISGLVLQRYNALEIRLSFAQMQEFWDPCQSSDLKNSGRVTYICMCELRITGSDNGLSPGRTSAGELLIGPLGTNLSEILIRIQTFSFEKMHLKT